eukprot:TRINITY_DN10435_c0_g2_i7.p1 TRINITY_DN10435_c0_g2~~TRINITY_DN10435_c0_g2_i7.p1  ORF type:complete len:462 (-),score=126.04 TRINITY_DN10435_c0_g2_i7:178-1563(-)
MRDVEAGHLKETHWRWNQKADELATAAADSHKVPVPLAMEYLMRLNKCKLLQKMMVSVLVARLDARLPDELQWNADNHDEDVEEEEVDLAGEEEARAILKSTPEKLYPRYPWKPTTGKGWKFPKGVEPAVIGHARKKTSWALGLAHWRPLRWYWAQLEWSMDSTVSWEELAMDYEMTTARQPHPSDNAVKTIREKGVYMKRMVNRMLEICKIHNTLGGERSSVTATLGLAPTDGLRARPMKFLMHEKLMGVMKDIALDYGKTGKVKGEAWHFKKELPTCAPLWQGQELDPDQEWAQEAEGYAWRNGDRSQGKPFLRTEATKKAVEKHNKEADRLGRHLLQWIPDEEEGPEKFSKTGYKCHRCGTAQADDDKSNRRLQRFFLYPCPSIPVDSNGWTHAWLAAHIKKMVVKHNEKGEPGKHVVTSVLREGRVANLGCQRCPATWGTMGGIKKPETFLAQRCDG